MPTQSGYPFLTSYGDAALVSNPTVPGSDAKIYGGLRKGSVATVLLYFAARFNAEVENLRRDSTTDDWGFDPQHNNTTTTSNHKGGAAMDLNSTRHPQHQWGTFSSAQYAHMRQIAQDLANAAGSKVLRLGIDFSGRSVDEMHVECAPGTAYDGSIDRAAAAVRAGRVPNVPAELRDGAAHSPAPSPAQHPSPPAAGGSTFPLPSPYYYGVWDQQSSKGKGHYSKSGNTNHGGRASDQAAVKRIQKLIGVTADGIYGPNTKAAVARWQVRHGLTADGLFGSGSWKKAGL